MKLVKWKGIEAYLIDDSRWGEKKYAWTPNPVHGTPFRNDQEARNAFKDSGAGRMENCELVEHPPCLGV